jgi:hypothetical protein
MKKLIVALLLALTAAGAFAQSNANLAIIPIASAARTATTVNSVDQNNLSWRCLHAVVFVSSYTSGNYTAHLQAAVPATPTNYYDLLVGPAISSTGTTVLKICPSAVALANASSADFLPRTWRVQMIGAGGPSMTFSVSGYLGN